MTSFVESVQRLSFATERYIDPSLQIRLDNLDQIYQQLRNQSLSGIDFRALHKAFEEYLEGEKAFTEFMWIVDGLKLSGKFD